MNALRTFTQIDGSGNLVVKDLPFRKGEFVEVLIFSDSNERLELAEKCKALFKDIRNNKTSSTMNESDINNEINEFRKTI